MKTNLNKFISWNQKHFEFIKRKICKEKQYSSMLNAELLALNYEKHDHENRIQKIKCNTDFSEFAIKGNLK